jgi:hypothetical protein
MTMITKLTYGAPFEGGFYGGEIRIREAIFAIVNAPKAEGEFEGRWLDSYTDVPGARSCFDSMANTIAMAEAGSELGKRVRGLSIGGHTDWCIPARDVVEIQHRLGKPGTRPNLCSFRDGDNASSVPVGYPYTEELPAQTSVAAFQAGGAEAFEQDWYWTSTQYSKYGAFIQDFLYGDQHGNGKKAELRVRAVRLIQLTP